jgi:ribosomal-protein-alanine N-acetyltransferase
MERRIYLEKLSAEDFDEYFGMLGNERVMAKITERALSEEEVQEKFHCALRDNEIHESYGTFKVMKASGNELLGFAKLEIKKGRRNEAELGYLVKPEYWGKGYGNEMAKALLKIAGSDPRLKRVYAITDPQNIASRKILLKNGFISEEVGEMDGLPSEVFGRNME